MRDGPAKSLSYRNTIIQISKARLMEEVVHCEDAPGVLVHAVGAVLAREQRRHEPGVPVVGDEHDVLPVREPAEPEHQRRLARRVVQQRVAEEVVAEGAVVIAVGVARSLVRRVVHEDPVDAVFVLVEEAHVVLLAEDADLRGEGGGRIGADARGRSVGVRGRRGGAAAGSEARGNRGTDMRRSEEHGREDARAKGGEERAP